jgi:Flp pilus assembly protein TadD
VGGGVGLRIVARLAQRWWQAPATTPSWRQLATVAVVLVGVVLASVLNPYGIDVLTLPFTVVDQAWFRHEVSELQPLQPSVSPGPFVLAGFLLLSLLATLARLPIIPVLSTVPFLHLALSAVRFVFLFMLITAPILARNLVLVTVHARGVLGRGFVLGGAAAALALAVITAAVTGARRGPFMDLLKVPGFGVNERWVPEGALRYLDARGVEGRVFNAFHFGGYITWRDFPRRVPIIDGRGHVPPSLLEELHFGLARADAGDDRGAVRYLARAQRAEPDRADVYPALIAGYQRLGDEESARDLGPAFLAAAKRARVDRHVRTARKLLAEGRMAEATEELSAALKLDPRNALVLSTLGFVRMAERRLDEAVPAEEEALAIDPRHTPAHWALAQIARARGDEPTARRHLETVARLAPRTFEAWQVREALGAARTP